MTISSVYLREIATGKMVGAELFDEISDAHLEMWEKTWKPRIQAHCSHKALTERPEDWHWDWRRKANAWRPQLSFQSFAIVCKGELQGLMVTNNVQSSQLAFQRGKPLVYVELVTTAPWNRIEIQEPIRYSGVGSVLMAAAIQLSLDFDFHGRIGLHAKPQAIAFYRKICGMTELGDEFAHNELTYFEMTAQQAESFRQQRGQK